MAPKDNSRDHSRDHSRRRRDYSSSRREKRSHYSRHSKYRERSRSYSRDSRTKKYDKDNINKSKDKKSTKNEPQIEQQPQKKEVKDENYERSRRKAKAALLVMLENEEKMKKNEEKNKLDMDFLSNHKTTENSNNELIISIDEKTKNSSDNITMNGKNDKENQITNENDDRKEPEVDPLDEYMKTIEKEATMQDYQIVQMMDESNHEIDPKKIVTIDDIKMENEGEKKDNDKKKEKDDDEVIMTDNFYQNFLSTIEKVVPTAEEEKQKAEDIIYQEDGVEYITNLNFSNSDEQWKKMKFNAEKGKELKPVNHNEINYEPFRKNLYIESQEISNMTEEEVVNFRKENGDIKVRGKNIPRPIFNWYHCGVNSTIIQILEKREIKKPFPIQMQAIPSIMSGRDIIGIAETGTGKTLAYVLPMLRHVLDQRPLKEGEGPIALILVPTRELAVQIYQEIRMFTKYLSIDVSCVYGGSAIGTQISELRRGREIVVATPGRFIEILCLSNGKITNLRRVRVFILILFFHIGYLRCSRRGR